VVNGTGVSVYRGLLGATYPSGSTGSGFVFDTVGHVVTNNHVIADSQRVYVTMYDGSNYPASVVGADVELDIAVLYVDFLGREVAPVEFGPSGRLQVGQTVFALGNPYGLEGTLTRGLVSGLRRPMETESGFIVQNLIQTDAAINPGNSGGPLISSDGRVVGMNVMLVSPTGSNVGIGFAIPSDTFVRMAEQIIDEGRVTKGWIDIHGVALNSALAATAGLSVTNGLLVTRVIDGGNADRAGLVDGSRGRTVMRGGIPIPVEGDVIVAIDSQPITTLADYLGALQTTQPGDVVELTVVRDGQTRMVTVELVARAQSSGKAQ
jgi:S1-C subfamily serine protease